MSADKSDDQVVRDMDDAEMIRRKHLWPLVDRLPLKRYRPLGGLDLALLGKMLADPHGDGTWLLAENMDVTGKPQHGRTVNWRTYSSPEAIVKAGWMID